MTWSRGKKWIKVWFVTSFQNYFWLKLFFFLVPVSVAVYYRESSQVFTALFTTIGILVLLGGSGILQKPKNQRIYAKEGILIVALCWILWSFFVVSLCFAKQIPSVIDAFLRSALALQLLEQLFWTTFSVLSRSLLFWRSFTHLIGGMGVLVLHLLLWTMPRIAT